MIIRKFLAAIIPVFILFTAACSLLNKEKKSETPQIMPKTIEFRYIKTKVDSVYQAYLGPDWSNNAFKYLSIDGNRYSYGVIMSYVNDINNNSIFFLNSDGGLVVGLEKQFDIEIAFYPPDKNGHETFKPFKILIVSKDNKIEKREYITNRTNKYKISK